MATETIGTLDYNEIVFPKLGIDLHVNSTAFSIGGLDIQWYGILITLGLVLAMIYAFTQVKKYGLNPDRVLDCIIGGIIGGVVGARAYYVLLNWSDYAGDWKSIFNIRGGGLAIYGGIIGGVLTAIVYCKRKGVNFWLLADTIAPCLAFGQMLGRWGNFFNREAFGGFTNGLLAMRLQVSQVRTSDISAEVMQHIVNYGGVDYIQVHPTFLYESLWNLCLFLLLIKFRPKKKFDGQVLGLYFLGYALGRVWIEGLRTDQLMFGPFAVSQLLSGGLIICAAIFLIRKGKQEKAKKESES